MTEFFNTVTTFIWYFAFYNSTLLKSCQNDAEVLGIVYSNVFYKIIDLANKYSVSQTRNAVEGSWPVERLRSTWTKVLTLVFCCLEVGVSFFWICLWRSNVLCYFSRSQSKQTSFYYKKFVFLITKSRMRSFNKFLFCFDSCSLASVSLHFLCNVCTG